MSALKLKSCLAIQIQALINLRRVSGTDYQSQAQLLGYFDRFLVAHGVSEPRITREITDAYQQSLSHLRPRVQQNRFGVVRQLCEYLTRTDPLSYVPESQRSIHSAWAFQPYIYSPSEVQTLLVTASDLRPRNSLRPETYRTLLGLLYTTGIRIGEALDLNLEDFDRDEQRLYIAEGKFRKSRWVPLSASTGHELQRYAENRLCMKWHPPDSPLFLNQRCRRLHHCTVNHTFRHLLKRCGISHHKEQGPRIHDLRHTFAVHRLLAWYRDGQDVNARLPWLATYMGHVDIYSTQVYLRPTAELWEQVDRRFHKYYLDHVKSHGGK